MRGFTVVELVVALALVGILTFVALSRTGSTDAFAQQAAGNELAAAMRHAQKTAVARRAAVYVRIDTVAGSVRFCLDAAPTCAQPVLQPGSTDPLRFDAAAGVALALNPSTATVIVFDGLGRVPGTSVQVVDLTLAGSAGSAAVRTWTQTGLTEASWTGS
ncbi:MAG: GspH/FimT family pseudopilin [Burkholderiales bacterium]|nr:MAG: GspH/FimT family pseudopilin [Burkholderiales bacterium]